MAPSITPATVPAAPPIAAATVCAIGVACSATWSTLRATRCAADLTLVGARRAADLTLPMARFALDVARFTMARAPAARPPRVVLRPFAARLAPLARVDFARPAGLDLRPPRPDLRPPLEPPRALAIAAPVEMSL